MKASEDDLRQVFADVFGVARSGIDEDTSIDTLGMWTSIQHLGFVLALEERFGVQFSEEQTLEILSYPLVKIVLGELGVEFVGGGEGSAT